MKTLPPIEALHTLIVLILNKSLLIAMLVAQAILWSEIPDGADVPFASARYTALMINACAVLIPLVRLLLFPEASAYAELGKLRRSVNDKSSVTTDAMRHYWFATGVSTMIVLIPFVFKA